MTSGRLKERDSSMIYKVIRHGSKLPVDVGMFNNMKMKMTILVLGMLFMLSGSSISAQSLRRGQMAINNIPMKDITQGKDDEEFVFVSNNEERFVYYSRTNEFWIHVLGQPYTAARAQAEEHFLQALDISRNESCFLDVNVMVPFGTYGFAQTDLPENIPYTLTHCEIPRQYNMNTDNVINGADFAQCMDDYESAEEDLPCDFNVNRRIDATDLSKMLQYMSTSLN
jgi:hypothetical protein